MSDHNLYIGEDDYLNLRAHLFKGEREEVSFLFASWEENGGGLDFRVETTYKVLAEELDFQSAYHVSLSDSALAKVIKTAWDREAVAVEVHSHRDKEFTPGFSTSDFTWFKETVSHIRWRLQQRPYVALVFSPTGFDGLVWRGDDNRAEALRALIVGDRRIQPSRLSLHRLRGGYGRK